MNKVYFVPITPNDDPSVYPEKVEAVFDAARFSSIFEKGYLAAIKLHFGERGNEGYIHPPLVRAVVDKVKKCGAYPFLTDTNTLYSGKRANTYDHLLTAREHGFTFEEVGAPVVIADGLRGQNQVLVDVPEGVRYKQARIASDIVAADALVVLTHVTGHLAAGYGGAIKNVGMGCSSRGGKLDQHSNIMPEVIEEKCTGDGNCVKWCPTKAITLGRNKKAVIDEEKCISCGQCYAVCPSGAIKHTWGHRSVELNERMAEHAFGALKHKNGRAAFFNFIINLTKECDCMGKKQKALLPDLGIVAGCDIVAVEKATIDLLNKAAGKELFRELYPDLEYMSQVTHAEKIGLGSTKYELVEV
ncbi:MAG: DUF362 domain-containing protein [Planctomycetota bacterium]